MGVNMPLFMVVHKWKKKDFNTVGKKVIEAMAQLPEGMAMCSSYCDADQTGAWCLWEAKSAEQLVEFFKNMPIMSSDVKPVLQFFPPSADLYQMIHIMLS
jgi:hypothetical protein